MPDTIPTGGDAAGVADAVARIVAARRDMPGALLPILHDIQDSQGFIPADAVSVVARALNLSRAEVHGVFTFYHDFRHKPAGRHVLKLCRAEACQAAGGDALAARAESRLGVSLGNTTAQHLDYAALSALLPTSATDDAPATWKDLARAVGWNYTTFLCDTLA